MHEIKSFIIKEITDLKHIAQQIAKYAAQGDIIFLEGDLGAGKTCFANFFINSLSQNNQLVTSPTFNILQTYNCNAFEVYHYDLYRVKTENEIYELDLDYAIAEALTLIEWPLELSTIIILTSSQDSASFKISVEE